MLDRRQLVQGLGAAGLALGTGVAHAKVLPPPAIGVQLYMLRDLLAKDLEGTLAAIARLGIRYVEFAGYYQRTASVWRTLLQAEGLQAVSAHGLYPDMTNDQVMAAIDMGAALGLRDLVAAVPRLPGLTLPITEQSFRAALGRITADDLKATADRFNAIGERVKAAGMRFAYHSHGFDFRRFDGTYGLDVILDRTDRTLVDLELDIGNTIAAGVDPMPWLASPRLRLAHVKDWRAPWSPSLDSVPASAPIGEGTTRWAPIMAALARARVSHVFIEQEGIDAARGIDLLDRNFRSLRAIGAKPRY